MAERECKFNLYFPRAVVRDNLRQFSGPRGAARWWVFGGAEVRDRKRRLTPDLEMSECITLLTAALAVAGTDLGQHRE